MRNVTGGLNVLICSNALLKKPKTNAVVARIQ